MAENKVPESCNSRKERQPISVPFVWEVRPGVPNKDWKPVDKPVKKFVPPVKLVASIPFEWEEKPGTPLPSFPLPRPSAESSSQENIFGSSVLPARTEARGDDGNDNSGHLWEAFCFESDDDSFSSAPSLLANGLISTWEISSAVPVEDINSSRLKSPPSPASETGSTSSYATGTTSLVGTAFLEKLFPLLSPELNSIEQQVSPRLEKGSAQNPEICDTGSDSESNSSTIIRKPLLTLGDLIMMSRRRSHQRKANQMVIL
ncbi:PREDICTED: uncharacterized protein LOC109186880 isoform X2 [Ipomoea nil]|uniref:uncharacterized protein LOC109186880 isoform X2 n=1 Tax=Ipomoea nil TaxID=35883 RepID=UPI000901146B|nr:PREDICTED: uncharacterized protein LOC109186880 isoform X2 [Ipomoea nil]